MPKNGSLSLSMKRFRQLFSDSEFKDDKQMNVWIGEVMRGHRDWRLDRQINTASFEIHPNALFLSPSHGFFKSLLFFYLYGFVMALVDGCFNNSGV